MKTESKNRFPFGKLFPKKIGKLLHTINNKKGFIHTPYISLIKSYLLPYLFFIHFHTPPSSQNNHNIHTPQSRSRRPHSSLRQTTPR